MGKRDSRLVRPSYSEVDNLHGVSNCSVAIINYNATTRVRPVARWGFDKCAGAPGRWAQPITSTPEDDIAEFHVVTSDRAPRSSQHGSKSGCLLPTRLPKASALTWKKETVARACVFSSSALWRTREPDWRTLTSIGSLKLLARVLGEQNIDDIESNEHVVFRLPGIRPIRPSLSCPVLFTRFAVWDGCLSTILWSRECSIALCSIAVDACSIEPIGGERKKPHAGWNGIECYQDPRYRASPACSQATPLTASPDAAIAGENCVLRARYSKREAG